MVAWWNGECVTCSGRAPAARLRAAASTVTVTMVTCVYCPAACGCGPCLCLCRCSAFSGDDTTRPAGEWVQRCLCRLARPPPARTSQACPVLSYPSYPITWLGRPPTPAPPSHRLSIHSFPVPRPLPPRLSHACCRPPPAARARPAEWSLWSPVTVSGPTTTPQDLCWRKLTTIPSPSPSLSLCRLPKSQSNPIPNSYLCFFLPHVGQRRAPP